MSWFKEDIDMGERVTVAMEGGVADVRLNRAEKMNALDRAMFDALIETGKALMTDRALRAVVLSGEGRAFCAGLDFASFMAMSDARDNGASLMDRPADSTADHAPPLSWISTAVPVPVSAGVHR